MGILVLNKSLISQSYRKFKKNKLGRDNGENEIINKCHVNKKMRSFYRKQSNVDNYPILRRLNNLNYIQDTDGVDILNILILFVMYTTLHLRIVIKCN